MQTVATAINDILSLWGIESGGTGFLPDAQARAMNDLNSAVQMIWVNPEKLNYFSRSEITPTITANTNSVTLTGIQALIGPVRITTTSKPLVPITSRYEFENFVALYYDGVAPAGPVAYYLDRETQSGPEALVMKLMVVPTPTVDTELTADVIPDAPEYTWADYTAGSGVGTPIPLPHAYGETLLLPIARKSAMTYFLFFKPERATMIEEQYQLAREMLGLAAPEIDEVKPETKPVTLAPWAQRREK